MQKIFIDFIGKEFRTLSRRSLHRRMPCLKKASLIKTKNIQKLKSLIIVIFISLALGVMTGCGGEEKVDYTFTSSNDPATLDIYDSLHSSKYWKHGAMNGNMPSNGSKP